jgi:hypothetical protein
LEIRTCFLHKAAWTLILLFCIYHHSWDKLPSDGILKTFCLSKDLRSLILWTSASQVAWITGMCHQHLARILYVTNKETEDSCEVYLSRVTNLPHQNLSC